MQGEGDGGYVAFGTLRISHRKGGSKLFSVFEVVGQFITSINSSKKDSG